MTLSLYHIDQTLQQLLDYRAERLADTMDPPDEEESVVLDSEIRKYLEQLPAKVDGVAAILRMLRGRHENIKAEIDRLKALDQGVLANEDRLKGYVAEILERQPMPKKGPRKLCGSTSELRLVGNGGVQPLAIDKPWLLPQEVLSAHVRLPLTVWYQILREIPLSLQQTVGSMLFENVEWKEEIVPSNTRIRAELAQDCPRCAGNGVVEQLEGEYSVQYPGENPCTACGGSGKQGIPGAHLEPRGSRVEVK